MAVYIPKGVVFVVEVDRVVCGPAGLGGWMDGWMDVALVMRKLDAKKALLGAVAFHVGRSAATYPPEQSSADR